MLGSVKTFVQELAGWVKKHHLRTAAEFLESALESEIEGARKRPTRDKIIKEAAINVADSIAFKLFQGPAFENWAGTLFEKIGQQASSAAREGVLELHRFRIEASDSLEAVGRYVGDPQDPDTEVPKHLSDDQLRRRFQALGAKPNLVEWSIRMVDTSTGRDLFSVYDFRVGIPLKTLVFEIFGKAALEAAAEKALSKSSVHGAAESKQPTRPAHSMRAGITAKKSAAQLDREIAEVVMKSKLFTRTHATQRDEWDVAMDAILEHDAERAARIVRKIRDEHGVTTAWAASPPPEFTDAMRAVTDDVRKRFFDLLDEQGITVEDGNDRASASRTTDDDGWIVELSDGHEKQKRFYPDSGGAWVLQKNGTLGRQLRGTMDERAPKDAGRMRSFLRSRVLGTL